MNESKKLTSIFFAHTFSLNILKFNFLLGRHVSVTALHHTPTGAPEFCEARFSLDSSILVSFT
jgi:hypothetical protein